MAAGAVIRTSVLTVLHPDYAAPVLLELVRAGWLISTLESPNDLAKHNSDSVGCLLLDSARKQLMDNVLTWCENSGNWRSVPKVILGAASNEYSNILKLRREAVQQGLMDTLINAQTQFRGRPQVKWSERRTVYRHTCNIPVSIEQNFTLLDVSVRGAALESFHTFNKGTRLKVHISEDDPLLRSIESEVTSTERRTTATFTVHTRFINITPAVDRALNQHLLSLQIRRVGSGYRPAI